MIEATIQSFLNYLRFEKRRSNHTLIAYTSDLGQLQTYLAEQYELAELKEVRHFHIRSFLASIVEKAPETSATTLNRKQYAISSLFRYALEQKLVETNPVKKLHSRKKPENLPTFLREAETVKMLAEAGEAGGFRAATDSLLLDLLYSGGLRRAELITLKNSSIEWGMSLLRVLGKGNKERLLPASPDLLKKIQAYQKEKRFYGHVKNDSLLVLESGEPLYANYVYRVVKKHLSGRLENGEEVTTLQKRSPHVLRHTFATHLLNNGANIQAIKDLLGHKSLAATQVYTHINIAKLKEIHEKNHPRG